MLTGKHKIGDRGVAIEFSSDDAKESTLIYNAYHRVALDSSELRHLRDLLNAHFGEWVPCGPDGPFPAGDAEDNYDVTFECKFENHTRRYVSVATLASIPWNAKQENWRVVAWKPRVKPYKPEGNAK